MKNLLIAATLMLISGIANSIEIVVPYSAGGPGDVFGRSVQKYLTAKLNRPVVAVNKPGADGRIGVDYIRSKPADATTLIVSATGPFLFNKVQYKTLSYDYTEFEMVVPIVTAPMMVAVSSQSQIQTFSDFIKEARSNKVSCGVSAASSGFAANYIKQKLALANLVVVPYKGVSDAMIHLKGSHIDCIIDAGFKNAQQDNRIKIIAIADDKPDPDLNKAELIKNYIPGYIQYNWFGIAMLKTDVPAKDNIIRLLKNIGQDPEFRTLMQDLSFNLVLPRTDYQLFLDTEYQKYDKIRESIGVSKID